MKPWSRFKEIKSALDGEDIEGLLALGCPKDEYDGEASLIESGIAKVTDFGKTKADAKQIEEIISRVWNDRFGPFDDEELKKRQPGFASAAKRLTVS